MYKVFCDFFYHYQVNSPQSVPPLVWIVRQVLILAATIRLRVSSVVPDRTPDSLGQPDVPSVPQIHLLDRWAPLHVHHVDHPQAPPLVHPSVSTAHGALIVQPDRIPLHLDVLHVPQAPSRQAAM